MGRPTRPTAAGFYHVAARGQADEQLFRDESDYLRFEQELQIVATDGGLRCLAACAMTTHYHLLVETAHGVLPVAMQRLNQRYARAYNARYGRRGHAFAERYLCVPVLSDEQLLTAYRYVVRNPVEAGLCARPGEWTWSSYATAIGSGDRFAFTDAAFMVSCCDGSLDVLRRFVESESGA
ncbi:MAG: REP-associated tyrosine transposase [Gaiellaceae bacterium]|jgi:putative transposase|nr:REP-associated tyrosine transposase [Gaiellaceae bacterium]MDX6440729.1 REP-associated tyrosine transposase [Gaiellaceae bacterium]